MEVLLLPSSSTERVENDRLDGNTPATTGDSIWSVVATAGVAVAAGADDRACPAAPDVVVGGVGGGDDATRLCPESSTVFSARPHSTAEAIVPKGREKAVSRGISSQGSINSGLRGLARLDVLGLVAWC